MVQIDILTVWFWTKIWKNSANYIKKTHNEVGKAVSKLLKITTAKYIVSKWPEWKNENNYVQISKTGYGDFEQKFEKIVQSA